MNKYFVFLYLLCLVCQNGRCVRLKEYHIPMPFTLEQYKIGLLYGVIVYSKDETGSGEGVEFINNEPFKEHIRSRGDKVEQGQFTQKEFLLGKTKLPVFIRLLSETGFINIDEKSWNFFPTTFTSYSEPQYMKERFFINVTSEYKTGKCGLVPVVKLRDPDPVTRRLEEIDIATMRMSATDYDEAYDPTKCASTKTDIGPLSANWQDNAANIMCANKVVLHVFQWWSLQSKVEHFIDKEVRKLMGKLNRIIFCTRDKWMEMSIEDIRKLEAQTMDVLQNMLEEYH